MSARPIVTFAHVAQGEAVATRQTNFGALGNTTTTTTTTITITILLLLLYYYYYYATTTTTATIL